jgi:N-acetylmuramoyl-L-alanine amidase
MGWLPQAIKRDVGAPGKYSNGLMRSHLGIVLHVNDSQGNQVTSTNGDSLYIWITGNHGMSCHFQISQMGVIEQYIDTRYSSWCQADGNDDYLSIETEGHPDTALTELQVQAAAKILAYVHAEHGIPLHLAEHPGEQGFGWHGMGAPAWGHASCPGDPRKAQRARILTLAAGGGQPVQEDDMPYSDWPAADRQALAADVATALVNRPLGGVNFPGSVADILKATYDNARAAKNLQTAVADLPAAVAAAVKNLPAGGQVDSDAIAQAVLAELSQRLDTAAGGPA